MPFLNKISEELGDCQRCRLSESRTNIVFGTGDPDASWMFCGEGPGESEDLQGLPFVGRSGKFLDQLIEDFGWDRESVYIANVVKCRPPGNRDPLEDEIEQCRPFLFQQIKAINPTVITTLGKPATNLLLGQKEPLYKLRGKVEAFEGIPVVPTYHPSYILRGNWKAKEKMVDDLATAQVILMSEGFISPGWKGLLS